MAINRLVAGNSLLECAVTGRAIGHQLELHYGHAKDLGQIPAKHRPRKQGTNNEALPSNLTTISFDTLQQHSTSDDLWMAVHGLVYNLTDFARQHPGGDSILKILAGTEATVAFAAAHSRQLLRQFRRPQHGLSLIMGRFDEGSSQTSSNGTLIDRPTSLAELQTHSTSADCWVAFHGYVYDMTEFSKAHKGGAYLIQKYGGQDATEYFRTFHKKEKLGMVAVYRLGVLQEDGNSAHSKIE